MTSLGNLRRRTMHAPCTVEIEHSAESLHAHVEFEAAVDVRPGDEILVHNAPVEVPYGTRLVVKRMATIRRAGLIERAWTRFAGHFEVTELYEVSFTQRRTL